MMIKNLLMVALANLTLISHNCFAFPAAGDLVKFEAMYQGAPVMMTKEVLSHDVESNQFEVHTLMTYKDNIIQDQTVLLPYTFLYTPEKIQDVIKHCEAREGAVGDMLVVGKKMKVCEFYNEDSQLTSILGPVPFGLIRFQLYLEGEEFLDFNLTKFVNGK